VNYTRTAILEVNSFTCGLGRNQETNFSGIEPVLCGLARFAQSARHTSRVSTLGSALSPLMNVVLSLRILAKEPL